MIGQVLLGGEHLPSSRVRKGELGERGERDPPPLPTFLSLTYTYSSDHKRLLLLTHPIYRSIRPGTYRLRFGR